jgi:hypothetical protein
LANAAESDERLEQPRLGISAKRFEPGGATGEGEGARIKHTCRQTLLERQPRSVVVIATEQAQLSLRTSPKSFEVAFADQLALAQNQSEQLVRVQTRCQVTTQLSAHQVQREARDVGLRTSGRQSISDCDEWSDREAMKMINALELLFALVCLSPNISPDLSLSLSLSVL